MPTNVTESLQVRVSRGKPLWTDPFDAYEFDLGTHAQRSRIASVLHAIPRSTQGLPVELEVFGATKRRMQVNGSFFAGLMPINSRSNRV